VPFPVARQAIGRNTQVGGVSPTLRRHRLLIPLRSTAPSSASTFWREKAGVRAKINTFG
jgi:hypothetical protein